MNSKRFAKSAIVMAVSAILYTHQAIAQEAADSEENEVIVVWGTQVKASSVYLGEQAIATRQADHVSDLLRSIPGVDVGGAHSLNQRITIRSMDDKDLKITIDGANQNNYMYHHMGNLQIHADILKSADIAVGTNSVLNGGLGGTARFETKTAAELLQQGQRFGAHLQTSYADNASTSHAITAFAQLTGNIDAIAYYNQVNRDNYTVGGGKILDANGDEVTGTKGDVVGLKGDINDTLLKLGWDIDQDQRLALSFESYKDQGNYSYRPDMGLATDTAITNSLQVPLLWPTRFTRDTLTLNYDLNWGDSNELKLVLFNNTSELARDESGWSQNPDYASWAADISGQAQNSGLSLQGNTLVGDTVEHHLDYALQVIKYQTDYNANYLSGVSDQSGEEAIHTSLAVQDQIDLGNALVLIPGIRYDRYSIDSTVVDNNFTRFSAAFAAQYTVTENLLLKASITGLFKGPEIGEVFIGAGNSDTANDDIEAESGSNSELALAYQSNINSGGKVSTGVTLFKTRLKNYIYDYAQIPGGGPRDSWKDNVGDMTVDGYEAYIGYRHNGFKVQLTYSDAQSELDAFAQYQALNGARLDRQQGDTIGLSADYAFDDPQLTLHWEWQHVDDVADAQALDGASKNNAKDGFSIHTVSLSYKPAQLENLSVVFGVDNLFDEFYASQSSRTGTSAHPRFGDLYLVDYEPGRNIKATLAYRF